MTRSAVPVRSSSVGRPLVAGCAAAVFLLGAVLAASLLVGAPSGSAHSSGWAVVCCVVGVGIERILRSSARRHYGMAIVGVLTLLAAGAVVWPFAAALLAAVLALAVVPAVLGDAFGLAARELWAPAIAFRGVVVLGIVGMPPAVESVTGALWSIAAAGAATAGTISVLGRRHSPPATPLSR
jgi:hypothetical protein